jgi:antitoxin component of RelBE/YafQ-DinJ toxin-antitoxin module
MGDRVRVHVSLDREVRGKALEQARKMGLSFSGFVNVALYEFIKQDSVVQLVDVYKKLSEGGQKV